PATHAAVAVDLGHLEIRLAVSARQAHLYSPLLRGRWHTPNRDTRPGGAERGHGAAQQVNDVVTSGSALTSVVAPTLEVVGQSDRNECCSSERMSYLSHALLAPLNFAVARYSLAVIAVGFALAVAFLPRGHPIVLCLMAIAVTVWYGGMGPGLF